METVFVAFILIGSAGCFGIGGSLSGSIGLNLNGLIGTPNQALIPASGGIIPTLSNPAVGGINAGANLGINLVGDLTNLGGILNAPIRGILPNLADVRATPIGTPNQAVPAIGGLLPTLINPAVNGINRVADLGINLFGDIRNLGGNLNAPIRGILPNLADLRSPPIIPNSVSSVNNPVNLDLRFNGDLNCDLLGKIRKAVNLGGNLLADMTGRVPSIANVSGVNRNVGGSLSADIGGKIGGIGLGARLFGSVNLFG